MNFSYSQVDKRNMPPGPCRKEGEDNGPTKGPTVNGWISIGFKIFGCASENVSSVSEQVGVLQKASV